MSLVNLDVNSFIFRCKRIWTSEMMHLSRFKQHHNTSQMKPLFIPFHHKFSSEASSESTSSSSETSSSSNASSEPVKVVYITKEGKRIEIVGKVGDNAMYLAHHNNVDIEGACEASLACCTCHVYVDENHFKLLSEPKEEEEDMLDLAPFLKPNSRLS